MHALISRYGCARARRLKSKAVLLLAVLQLCRPATDRAAVNVLAWHNDNFRTGQNTNETALAPANVNTNGFGLLFSYPVDGKVYAQPLYVNGLTIPGLGTRNVVFVATEHDSVYAFDADGGGLIWNVNLGTSAVTPNNDFGNRYGPYHDIDPEVGITSTPVIDPIAGVMYVDAFTHEGTSYFHRIHALNITNGMETPFSPVLVTASVPGNGVDSVGGVVTFNPMQEIQRPALTLAGGNLYVAFAGYADTDPYHGWVIGFNAANLAPLTNYIFNTSPNSTIAAYGAHAGEAGVWMSGSGLGVDAQTNLFFVVGNGSYNANTAGGTEYGESAVRLATTNGLTVKDFFTPYNQSTLSANDTDFGSGGPLLLPDSVGSLAHPHLMVACGKQGTIYLLDRDNLGHFNAGGDTQIVQSLPNIIGGTWSSPAYFNQRVYFAGSGDALKMFTLTNGLLSTSPVSQSGNTFGWPGATPAISANGTNQAIAWAVDTSGGESGGDAVLHAYDAYHLTNELYNSSQAGVRDELNVAVKFVIPTVANGKVYVGATKQLAVYGQGTFLALPVISPAGGYFTNSVAITVTESTSGATIYYSLDGSMPGTNSPVYTGPLTLTNTALLRVAAFKTGYVPGAIISAAFINSASAHFAAGFVRQEFYPGALRTDLENPGYSGQPTSVNYLSTFETPGGQGNNYAERVSGYFIPPATTNYVFFVCSDDDSDLFLSTDSSPANKHLIAQETAWSNSREWTSSAGGSTLAAKRSDQFTGTTWPGGNTIHLQAGTRYYIEADHHQGTGGDDFAATFKYATVPDPTNGSASLLTGTNIGVTAYDNTFITVAAPPQDAIAIQNSTAAFSVSAASSYLGDPTAAGPAMVCQWQSAPAGSVNFTDIPGANNFFYTTPTLAPAQNGERFRAVLTTAGFATNTPFATLTVVPDTHTPVPVAVLSVSANARTVVVQFSEALDPATAQAATNYVFAPGNIAVTSAVLDGTGSNVTLTAASALPAGANLTLSVSGVKNLFGNTILPGASLGFSFGLSGVNNYAAAVMANGPLACWRLNETNGSVAADVTGAFNGTYASGATQGVAGPRPPTFAGFETTNNGTEFYYNTANSYVTVPALNLNTNTVTFLAWLYPIGNQANYAGLLMTRAGSTQAGLGYTTGNQIGYTWNGNTTWTFQSGLIPPQNQWSLVAMVISPAQAVLYLLTTNGVQAATNAIAHQNEVWNGSAQIGNDSAGGNGSRTFNGVMDEVAVFNKSLTLPVLTNLFFSAVHGGANITNNPPSPANFQFTSIQVAAGKLVLQWNGSGTLLEATNVSGPWSAASQQGGLQTPPSAGNKFYRLQH